MLTQIENTPDGYIVGVYLRDGAGNGQWYRLRNFGDRQGDAIEFREWDIPTFTDAQIRLLIKTFKIENRGFGHNNKAPRKTYQITATSPAAAARMAIENYRKDYGEEK